MEKKKPKPNNPKPKTRTTPPYKKLSNYSLFLHWATYLNDF